MEQTKTTEHFTGGVLEEVDFPRSTIYVSANKKKKKTRFTCQTKEGCFHFYLLLNAGVHYTQNLIDHCNGRLQCFNCTRPIQTKVYLYPENIIDDYPICNVLPHCRPECALRTVEDTRENHDLKASFFLMYGLVKCAPNRALLHMLSLAGYHAMIDGQEIPEDLPEPRCHNCNKLIEDKTPILFPEKFTKSGQSVSSKLPHCRVECALRTVNNIPHNAVLKVAFFRKFGKEARAAPHRMLLYIPGHISLDTYHTVIDDNLVVEIETPNIRAFLALTFISKTFLSGHTLAPDVLKLKEQFKPHAATRDMDDGLRLVNKDTVIAPIYLSCTHLKNYQLVPDVIALTEEMGIESKTAAGPGRTRDNSKLSVVELTTQNLTKTSLSQTFAIDPASSRCG